MHGKAEAEKPSCNGSTVWTRRSGCRGAGTTLSAVEFRKNSNIIDLLPGKADSFKAEGRRLVKQGGIYVNDERIDSIDHTLGTRYTGRSLMIRRVRYITR